MVESVPQVAPEQPPPVSAQSHPAAPASLVTVQENALTVLVWTLALPGETDTTITGAGVTVMVATALFVLSVVLVAVRLTVAGDGTAAGPV